MVPRLLMRGVTVGAVILGAEAAYAVFRPVPRLVEFDPSGVFGDPGNAPLRIAVLGDSSVTAPGVAGPHEIWVSLVCRRIAESRHVTLHSLAVGGSRAEDVVSGQLEPALVFDPDLVIVSVGANDVFRGVSLKVFARHLEDLVATLEETGAVIVLSGVGDVGTIPRLKPPLRNVMTRRSARFDRVHHEVAARHGAHVVEQRKDNPAIWYSDRGLWSPDLFHVSAAGHQRWAAATWRTVEPLIGPHGPV